ncbi:hypothetical protein M1563_03125 [Patescibacteria group bacterium]|nr:hypothetical protein [Patescibacteria group bacterium]MCL5409792.1 hypothetical protein [Patescibacteria group bacterium]
MQLGTVLSNRTKVISSLIVIALSLFAINFLPLRSSQNFSPTKQAQFYPYKVELINATDNLCGQEPQFYLSDDQLTSNDPLQIAKQIANKWLTYHQSTNSCGSNRLVSFQITDLKLHSQQDNQFVVTMLYNVKPISAASRAYWLKMGGTVSGDGSVNNIFSYLTFSHNKDIYSLDKISASF